MTEPQSTEAPVREGDVLAGKYRVERILGVGGMGVVVAAMHTELEQRVALKFLLPEPAKNPAVVARFAREARAAAKIKSEHVARVSDVGTMEDGLPYIVMEYLDGHDLSHRIAERGRLPAGLAVDYVLQACEAIAEAHAVGFVHRDLKPGNLFVAHRPDGSETVKVLDFGISKAVIADAEPSSVKPGALTRTTDIFGSPLYMSPEQLKSSRDVDPRADIWAIGVILYELVTGKSPFDRPTVAETFGAILYEKPEPIIKQVPGFPADLDAAIARCIEKDANARFPNVAELVKALLPFAESVGRESFERTSRVLMRAGVAVDSGPPASMSAQSLRSAVVPNGGAVGAQTRTSWGATDRAPKPRSGGRVALLGAAGLVAVGGIVFGITRLGGARPAVPAPVPEHTAPAVTAPVPTVTPSAAPTLAPTATATSVATVAPTATATTNAGPTVTPGAPAPSPRGKTPHGKATPPPAVPTGVAAPPPPSPPTPPPPPKPEDPNDFGDRK